MKFLTFAEQVQRLAERPHTIQRDPDITIRVHSPGGIGPSPSVAVEAIHAGFDWDAGQVMIYATEQLTTLTPEQVRAIETSVRAGQSWHAYEAHKKHKKQLEDAAVAHAAVATQRDALLVALKNVVDGWQQGNDVFNPMQAAREAITNIEGDAV